MSTNYYIKLNNCKCCNRFDKIHLGKRSSIGNGECKFTYAVDLEGIEKKVGLPFDKDILDEYGRNLDLYEFKKLVSDCKVKDYSLVGTNFS
jgi:hypothetical protein